jgi:hypothetical protein
MSNLKYSSSYCLRVQGAYELVLLRVDNKDGVDSKWVGLKGQVRIEARDLTQLLYANARAWLASPQLRSQWIPLSYFQTWRCRLCEGLRACLSLKSQWWGKSRTNSGQLLYPEKYASESWMCNSNSKVGKEGRVSSWTPFLPLQREAGLYMERFTLELEQTLNLGDYHRAKLHSVFEARALLLWNLLSR